MKKKIKIIMSALTACAVLLSVSVGLAAADEQNEVGGAAAPRAGAVAGMEEVVYSMLDSDGSVKTAWVVGTLDVTEAGTVSVYADATSLKNLTSTNEISSSGEKLSVEADEGRLYWQGELTDAELPWNVEITYRLDGREVTAQQLAGAEGELELELKTSQNKGVNTVFYDNYLIQISVTLDTLLCKNIVAEGATGANSGRDRVLTFTALPGSETNIKITADVTDFEMAGISLAAMPYSMELEIGDMSSFTDGFTQLADAVSELNSGVRELRDGAQTLSDGMAQLSGGSNQYRAGLEQVAAGGEQLKGGSESIMQVLGGMGGEGLDMSALSQLPAALTQMTDALDEIAATLDTLANGYGQAYTALEGAINAIPEASITESDLYALYAANPNNKTVDALVKNYEAAQTVKGTYAAVSEAFAGVNTALPQLKAGISEVSSGLKTMSGQMGTALGSLDVGSMAGQYSQFHEGLVAYVDGVSALATGYAELNAGLGELSGGTAQLAGGMSELSNGVGELDAETSKLPEQVSSAANEMIEEYTGGGEFSPLSFLSEENEGVTLVQFVLMTEGITVPEPEAAPEPEAQAENFWTRLLDLFR